MKERIQKLIQEGEEHTFRKNCYQSQYGVYGRAGIQMQAWIADVEDFILTEFGAESAPWRVFKRFSRGKLDGNEEQTFQDEKNYILSALHACLRIAPKADSPSFDKSVVLRNTFERFHLVVRSFGIDTIGDRR